MDGASVTSPSEAGYSNTWVMWGGDKETAEGRGGRILGAVNVG